VANKTHRALKLSGLRTSVMAVASCLALSGVPLAVQAAGLGKIVVFSALGQPLRAEIEVSATRDELVDMKAQLASPDAFKQAGLDYASTLLSIRFALDKRSNGQSIIRLSSDKPINDPFVDMLLELNWPAGRLVREYTFLLDPPEVAVKSSVPVAPATTVSPAVAAKPSVAVRTDAPIDDEVRSKALARVRPQETAQKSAEKPAEARDAREVKRGDTLHRIASETKPEGVSLEQMLVSLLRANQEAFSNGNMNRLKAGKILKVPEKSAIEAVSTVEAKKIVVAQSADWNAYRSKLAAVAGQAPVKEEAAKQEATGKITAKVEDKAAPAAEAKDQLKVSKPETAVAKPGATEKRSEEDRIANEKALKEAKERQAALENTVAKLEKVLELKNQDLAVLQKQAAAKAAPAEDIKPPVPAAVTPPAKVEPVPAAVEKPVEKPAEKPVEPVAEISKPEIVQKPVDAPKPKLVIPPPPPPEEPGFFEDLLGNPMALAGGGGVLALIAAYFVARRRRAGKGEAPLDLSSTMTPQSSSLTANSVFRSTGGQSVDTSHTPIQTDFSQAGPGSIDTDEVDPVAEADVYMAYGRDAQAEEILVEARQKDPKRYAIHLKLLEIYSNRKDIKQFETLATDLYSETSGVGADWEKAAAMGLKLDPGNPLYGASAKAAPAFDADATVVVPSPSMKNTVTLPGELSQIASVASAGETLTAVPADSAADDYLTTTEPGLADLTSLDFDLGLGDTKPLEGSDNDKLSTDETIKLDEPVDGSGALDFDLETNNTVVAKAVTPEKTTGMDFARQPSNISTSVAEADKGVADLDFDIGIEASPAAEPAEAEPFAQKRTNDEAGVAPVHAENVEFDVNLTESTFLGRSMPQPSSYDLTSIDLDLETPEVATPPLASPPPPVVEAKSSAESPDFSFENAQVSTAVNPDFAMEQAETIVNPQFGLDQDNDLMPEHDFSKVSGDTIVAQPFNEEADLAPEFDISANEEVTTKLDLAKAYEEMGDFEGARELLQEVIKEGDVTQREKAQTILAKIGG
jgi:pilus assembly protein FimV